MDKEWCKGEQRFRLFLGEDSSSFVFVLLLLGCTEHHHTAECNKRSHHRGNWPPPPATRHPPPILKVISKAYHTIPLSKNHVVVNVVSVSVIIISDDQASLKWDFLRICPILSHWEVENRPILSWRRNVLRTCRKVMRGHILHYIFANFLPSVCHP